MERAVGADLQIGVLARLEGLIGFLVPGLERLFQRLQGRLAVGEGIKLSSLQILGAACFPLRLRNEVFVQGAIFLRMDQIKHTRLDGIGDLDIEQRLVQRDVKLPVRVGQDSALFGGQEVNRSAFINNSVLLLIML